MILIVIITLFVILSVFLVGMDGWVSKRNARKKQDMNIWGWIKFFITGKFPKPKKKRTKDKS